jgi:hypothetical protein
MIDPAEFTALLKHFYGREHTEYPECPKCLASKLAALKARLVAKYRGGRA